MKKSNRKSLLTWLEKVASFLVLILPAVLFFSYYPVISFGANETMNFELSLPMIWLVIFDVVALSAMAGRKTLFKSFKGKWVWLLFPIWLTISVVWSKNVTRGILTVGILWLIYFAAYAMWNLRELFDAGFRQKWWKWFFGATLIACAWCNVQCLLDVCGVGTEYTLMCPGCGYQTFGFPHPNGMAAEPQFMGNLLLAPAIAIVYILITGPGNLFRSRPRPAGPSTKVVCSSSARKNERARSSLDSSGSLPRAAGANSRAAALRNAASLEYNCHSLLWILLFVVVSTLFLTLSRGAIFAFGVAMVGMTGVLLWKNRGLWKRLGLVWLLTVVSFLFALNLQGFMAEVSPTDDTYFSGVSKSVNQLTLGVVDLGGRDAKKEIAPEEGMETKQANFDGYVEVSTEARMGANEAALKAGFSSWQNALFGVGLGSASIVMYEEGVFPTPKEIVNNEYLSLFLETGLVGIILAVYSLVLVIGVIKSGRAKMMIVSLMIAYLTSLCFFSGLANVLHIYLLMPLLMVFSKRSDSAK